MTVTLCCAECGRPILPLNERQAAKYAADPERYRFVCTRCISGPPIFDYRDALDG